MKRSQIKGVAASVMTSLCLVMQGVLPALAIDAVAAEPANVDTIILSDNGVAWNGQAVTADDSEAVYIGNDIVYYESGHDSSYGASTNESEQHTSEEAAEHIVVTITKAGTYRLQGSLSKGQVAVDLGDDADSDENAVVTLILDNVDVNCDVAPAIIFYNVYECGSSDAESASATVDTSAAGANVVIADNSVNNISGSHVAKIYKEGTTKKLHKYDGAFYSKMSMNIDGETLGNGILNITADNEGLDSELHLTINGGNINIFSQDDGINTNEDGVSVTTVNGGCLHICAGLGSEGDGVDSNGWLVINGGVVIATANPASDSGLDSDSGSYVNGGTVVALGSTMDWAESESNQTTINLQFASMESQDKAIVITDQKGSIVFAYDPDQDEVTGAHVRNYQGAVLSSSSFQTGETYYVYLGGTIVGTDVSGLYDVSTITSYTGGVQQSYTGTDVGNMFGGGMGGMNGQTPPEGMTMPEGQTAPEGMTMPEGQTAPEGMTMPEGQTAPEGMTMPEGQTAPEGMTRPEGQTSADGTQTSTSTAESSVYFYLTDKVNAFSGVADAAVTSEDNKLPEETTADQNNGNSSQIVSTETQATADDNTVTSTESENTTEAATVSEDTSADSESTSSTDSSASDGSVSTGDHHMILIWAVGLLLSAGVIVTAKKKRTGIRM